MRYIDLAKLLENRPNWGHSAKLWKNPTLKTDFRNYFHNKCWYTECDLTGHDVWIDHFRPKGAVVQYGDYYYNAPLRDCGYTWLINDPQNYRACCVIANRITAGAGKGNYFPLKENSPLLTQIGTEIEETLLLDPCNRDEVELFMFFGAEIQCTSEDETNKTRVTISSHIYNMSNGDIRTARSRVWEEITKTWSEYTQGDLSQPACLQRLKNLVDRKAPFSACAISCVRSIVSDEMQAELDLEL